MTLFKTQNLKLLKVISVSFYHNIRDLAASAFNLKRSETFGSKDH
jgi:hypothetical protein